MATANQVNNNNEGKETDEYYRSALDLVFRLLNLAAYVTVGRWSYAPDASNPRVFNPGGIGGLDRKMSKALDEEFRTSTFRHALRDFSFTKLMADSDKPVWFHFTNENPPAKGQDQVYLGKAGTAKRALVIEVASASVTPELASQLVGILEREMMVTEYGGVPLRSKVDAIAATLDAAIFSLFTKPACGVRHVSFMPVTSTKKNVVGILSINSAEHIKVAELQPILQPFATGIMAPFHLEEIDKQRQMFSLRSAIAAIMSRNMSHNIGSHVLWHVSQQLKPKLPTLGNKS